MTTEHFVDTNVLVYAHDRGGGRKSEVARDLVRRLWDERSAAISTQVLQELYVNVRRKAEKPISRDEAAALVSDYLAWEVVVNTERSVVDAIALEERHQISFWDALIVRAAQTAGASILYSEDLSHGQSYGTLRVINPFSAAA